MEKEKIERKFIYSIIVAGKTAKFANEKIDQWLSEYNRDNEAPIESVTRLLSNDRLRASFEDVKTGNYNKLTRAMKDFLESDINLLTCTPYELERKIWGIGPKTARFFVTWARPNEEYAVLDTHILQWMNEIGYDVPESTPQNDKKYARIEEKFIEEAKELDMTARELDKKIWQERSTAKNIV
jgi:thermostable 8-oxoguanine DNA glycosylase